MQKEEKVIDNKKLLKNLKKNGWVLEKGYIESFKCSEISESLKTKDNIVNQNSYNPTYLGSTLFNTNILAASKEAFNICCSRELINLCEDFIGEQPRLKCVRSYRISKRHKLFRWHADNKDPLNSEPDNSRGLVFIIFLEDDIESSFWLAQDSFNSATTDSASANAKQIKNWEDNNQILKVPAEKGDLLIFSQNLFHRHIISKQKNLKAMWWQVIGSSVGLTEKIVVSTEFLKNDPKILNYLGSGFSNIGYSNPDSKIYHLNVTQLIKTALICLYFVPIVALKSIKMFIKIQYNLNFKK